MTGSHESVEPSKSGRRCTWHECQEKTNDDKKVNLLTLWHRRNAQLRLMQVPRRDPLYLPKRKALPPGNGRTPQHPIDPRELHKRKHARRRKAILRRR